MGCSAATPRAVRARRRCEGTCLLLATSREPTAARSDTRFHHPAGISEVDASSFRCAACGTPRRRGAAIGQRLDTVSAMSAGPSKALVVSTEIACGVVATPLFVGSFTVIGARRAGYDWRRHAVSSLGTGQGGWSQRANFALTGALYCIAAHGLARSPRLTGAPRVVPALIFGVGVGLVGSGLFVTDPVAGFPPSACDQDGADRVRPVSPTRSGKLHNLCAIPIFAGIPVAALISATSATRSGEYRSASYSAGSALSMMSAFVLFGAAFGGKPRLAGRGGVFQRISVTAGFGWLSALSLRGLSAVLLSRRT